MDTLNKTIRIWLEKAEKDLEAGVFNIDGEKYEEGVFFLQQCAEKALKSKYIKERKNLFKTHDLILLAKRVNAPKKIIGFCEELNPADNYTRYPDMPRMLNLEEKGKELIKYAEEILKWVKENI